LNFIQNLYKYIKEKRKKKWKKKSVNVIANAMMKKIPTQKIILVNAKNNDITKMVK